MTRTVSVGKTGNLMFELSNVKPQAFRDYELNVLDKFCVTKIS